MINLIQPSPSSKPTMELLMHDGEHHEIGDGGWLMMTMATDSPLRSPNGLQISPPEEDQPYPLGAPSYLVRPLDLHRPQFQLHIFTFGEKKIREKDSSCFTIRSHRQALFFLGGLIWSPFGASERGIHRHRHHQPSSITNFMMLTIVR